ncbi:peptide MFS transporter [Rheinheimera maricola]|uniref:Peptide MFS transporter n=1 Tax=Rheinheimera maricola TaxID=2793282 RepID=A0ABS7X9S5_9GAMM|nr:peptide MFS transporter [Rheinheimera maricola]MBZ9611924.1 peptide MFS transporter [Rheinheimera maricola]
MQKNSTDCFGHPKGLFLLFSTEMWERFSYYAMRALLVLYLVDQLQAQGGGLGWDHASALQLYGTFTMLVYVTPLIGGWLADNWLGQRNAILAGAVLMALGQFCLALPHSWFASPLPAFYSGLALLVLGNGLFKPNISTMVGDLYSANDKRRDSAFTIFYLGINAGMFLAGIAVGITIDAFGYQQDGQLVRNYQAGFLLAGIGMLLALLLQLSLAKRLLGNIGTEPAARKARRLQPQLPTTLTKAEIDRLKVLLIMGLFTIIFWAGFEQAGGLMNIYADRFTERNIGSWQINPTYFQSLNPLFILIFAPLLAVLWIKLGKREPNSPLKFALGLLLLGIGFLFMVGASLQYSAHLGGDSKASLWWLVCAYLFFTLGELCLSPIGLALVCRLAPLRVASLLMGAWYLFLAAANKLAGLIGALLDSGDVDNEQQMVANALAIFSGFSLTAILAAILLYFLADKLVYWMHGKG